MLAFGWDENGGTADNQVSKMKKIGIVGGAAWPSTLEYYRVICEGAVARHRASGAEGLAPTPPMMIESLVMAETRALRGRQGDEESWAGFDAVIRDALKRLEAAGCDFAIIANNTMHTRLHALRRGLAMPVLSILDVVAEAAAATGAKRALVLGTSVTMRAGDYRTALAARGVTANDRLADDVIDRMQATIDAEFYGAQATAEGRRILLDICRAHAPEPGTAILLACTELPLAFPDHASDGVFTTEGFTFVNTSAVHAEAALTMSMG